MTQLSKLVGRGKEFALSEVPTVRAVIQRGLLIKERLSIEEKRYDKDISVSEIVRELVPLILLQWHKSNAKFTPPVIVQEKSLVTKVERIWERVSNVARGRTKKSEKDKVMGMLDSLLDITTCSHIILLLGDVSSGCPRPEECLMGAHIRCSCPLASKVPVMELRWLYSQRNKKGEYSDMMMGSEDRVETERQIKSAKRKTDEEEAILNRKRKQANEDAQYVEDQQQVRILYNMYY